jgi:hypothetical protein
MANGQLDISQLMQISGEPGDLLRSDAARYWNALQVDFRKAMGYGLTVNEAYRPLGTQRTYFFGRYRKTTAKTSLWYEGSYWVKLPGVPAASIPGRSKHGDALAVDVDIYSFGSAAYQWLSRNAGLYGFGNAQGRADGEPWHWVFGESRASISLAGYDLTPIGSDDMPLTNQDLIAILNASWTRPDGRVISIMGALDAVLFYGDLMHQHFGELPRQVWEQPLTHSIAREDGTTYTVPAGDLLRHEPLEHQNTRAAVAKAIEQGAGIDIDYERVVEELKASGLDSHTIAIYAADEADNRERQRLAAPVRDIGELTAVGAEVPQTPPA